MGFTTPCFIRKNTPELRKKLEELGYKLNNGKWMGKYLAVFQIKETKEWRYVASPEWDLQNNPDIDASIDCGTNEELFLAIAALRDDSNYMQWFIAKSSLSVSFGDAIGNDHYFIEPKGSFFFWGIEYQNATIISGNFRKATVNELIEHFKTNIKSEN